jgi:hypothetical protein
MRTACYSQLSVRRDHSRVLWVLPSLAWASAPQRHAGPAPGGGAGKQAAEPTARVQYDFPPSSHHSEQPPRAPELLARGAGGARNLFRRRSERLTSATAAHGGQGVRQVDPRVSRSRPARTRTSGPSDRDHDSDGGRQTMASGRPTAAGCQYGTFTGPHEVLPQWLRYPRRRLMSGARKQAVRLGPAVQHSSESHGPSTCCPNSSSTLARSVVTTCRVLLPWPARTSGPKDHDSDGR